LIANTPCPSVIGKCRPPLRCAKASQRWFWQVTRPVDAGHVESARYATNPVGHHRDVSINDNSWATGFFRPILGNPATTKMVVNFDQKPEPPPIQVILPTLTCSRNDRRAATAATLST
jgi:hypothetical protein